MEGRVSYTAVGVFVITLIVAAIAIFFWLTLRKHDQNYDMYVVYLHEEVTGLSVQSPVRYNGVPVGFVKSIGLEPSNPQLVKVMLDIESGTPINTSTVATLMSQGITGVDYVGLQSEQVNAPPLTKHQGESYPVIPSKPSLLMQLSEVLPEITGKITQLSDSISELFDAKNRTSIAATLQNLQVFTAALKQSSGRMTASMASLQTILQHGQVVANQLPALVQATNDTLSTINKTAQAFDLTAHVATQALNSGKVAINSISQQVVPSMQQALQQLGNIEVNLSAVTNQLKRNPSLFIRGKQPTQPGPGEKR